MKLQAKLTLATTGVITAVTLAVGGSAIATNERSALDAIDQTLTTAAATIEGDTDKLQAAILASNVAGDSLQVALLDSTDALTPLSINDTTIVDLPTESQLAAAAKRPRNISESWFSLDATSGAAGYRLLVVPISEADYKYVLLAISLDRVAENRVETVRTMSLIALIAILVGAFANALIVRRQARKISRLTSAAARIAEGDLEQELVAQAGSSEIDELSKALNDMVASLKHSVRVEQAAQERMQEFLGDASHELRTPLTVIRGYVELLERNDSATPEQRARAFERIQSEIKRMEALIRDLLQIAELSEATAAVVQIDDVDLSEIVQTAADDLRALQPERRISVAVEPGLQVQGREDLLRQLLANLFGNISRHTAPVDEVRVSLNSQVRSGVDWVVLAIDDAGPGLPEAAYQGELDAFKRFDPSRSRENGGSGLGMSIVAGIVRSHLGSLKLSKSELGGLRTEIALKRLV
mgnify:FL=1